MSRRDTYLLQVYRGRAASGRQWAARLTHVSGGEYARFRDPEALLAHLRALITDAEPPEVQGDAPMSTGDMETSASEGECHQRS
jgi:hypothetical protein